MTCIWCRYQRVGGFGRSKAEQGAKKGVLDDRELAEHLGPIHLDEAGEHFAPVRNCTDVPKLVAVLVEGPDLTLWI